MMSALERRAGDSRPGTKRPDPVLVNDVARRHGRVHVTCEHRFASSVFPIFLANAIVHGGWARRHVGLPTWADHDSPTGEDS